MKLVAIRNAATSQVGRAILRTQKNSPQMLFGAGVVGVVASTVLACRATLKLDDILVETENNIEKTQLMEHPNYSEADRKHDQMIIRVRAAGKIVKIYAPAMTVGVASIAALTGSHVIINRRNVALTAAYSALDQGFREYRARVREELGNEKDIQFRHGPVREIEVVDEESGKLVKKKGLVLDNGPSVYARTFDERSSSWQKIPAYNSMFLMSQQNYANDLLQGRGHIFLNEVYDMLGLPRSKEGAVVGWVKNHGDNYVDFGIMDNTDYNIQRFVNGDELSILLDFNVDGVIYDLIDETEYRGY